MLTFLQWATATTTREDSVDGEVEDEKEKEEGGAAAGAGKDDGEQEQGGGMPCPRFPRQTRETWDFGVAGRRSGASTVIQVATGPAAAVFLLSCQ